MHVLRLSGITPESLVDGPGIRYVIFTQGCLHSCPNCHNPSSWDVNAGKEFNVKEIIRKIKKNKGSSIRGITFSGGEPFLQAKELTQLALASHQIGWDVVTYTGYTYEELLELEKTDSAVTALLCATNLLIDGRYVHEKQSKTAPFRGSANQRIIDVAKTREKGEIVVWRGK